MTPNDLSNAIILGILGAMSMAQDSARSSPQAPTLRLSGEPSRMARPSVFYSFSPTVARNRAADSNLVFSIENKPVWASFGRRHGTLYGVPHQSDAGTYSNIRITATDGNIVADLQAFTLVVASADDH
jgi:large repetitive protein